MARRASDLISIPDSLWQRPETVAALRERDVGYLFLLLRKYANASQTQLAIACGMTQPTVSDIMRGVQQVERLAIFERIADALEMPNSARVTLGLAPRATSHLAAPAQPPAGAIPAGDSVSGLDASRISDLLNLGEGDGQEEEDPVRRRSFIGASMLGAMFTGIAAENR